MLADVAQGQRDEGEHQEYFGPCPDGREPLAVAQTDHGRGDAQPDEGQAERELRAFGGERRDELLHDADADRGDDAAEPDRVADPIEEGGKGGGIGADALLDPFVEAALDRQGGAKLGHEQGIGQIEGEPQTMIQVRAWPPATETWPSVSKVSMAQTLKK